MTARLRFSTLKHFASSPAHFRYWQGREMEPSAAMRIGTAVHAAVLGGAPVVRYDGTRRGKDWEAFQASYPNATILTATECDVVEKCADSLRYTDASCENLFGWLSHNERLIEWDFNGVPFRSTPDRYYGPSDAATLVELKTTRSAQPARFLRDATSRWYHSQLAVYRAALATVGVTVAKALIVAVETVPPYNVTVLELTDRALDVGYRTACGWLEQYKVCEASGEWPGYVQGPVTFDIEPEMDLDFSGIDDAEEA